MTLSIRAIAVRTLLLIGIAISTPLTAAPQESERNDPLTTDRPDFTESTASVQPRRVQLETGYTWEKIGEIETQSWGEILLRIGLSEIAELRLGVNSFITEIGAGAEGIEDSFVGAKFEIGPRLGDQPTAKPELAVLAGTTLPTGASDVGADDPQPGALLAAAWTVSERLSLGANLGAIYLNEPEDSFWEGSFSLALGADLGRGFGAFVEYFVLAPEGSAGDPSHFFDAGLTYLISNDFQLDLRVGAEAGGETDAFLGLGLAYRW